MATASERGSIIALVNVIFDAAPGGYLNELVGAFNSGASLLTLANAMANTSVAKSAAFYPTFLTNGEFAQHLVDNLSEATPLAPADRTLAIDYITGLLNGGQSRGQVFLTVSTFLNNPATLSDAQFGALAQQFQNEVTVATYYTVDKDGTSTEVATLQAVLGGVTDSAASVTAAKLAIDNGAFIDGKTFTLTTGQDTFVGTGGVDTFFGVIDFDNTVNTLNSFDKLDGGGGFDTLNLVVNDDLTITPEIVNIEKISLRVIDNSTASLDFSNVSGVKILEMRDSPVNDNVSADIEFIQEWIPTVSLMNVARETSASMTLSYDAGVDTTNDTLTVLLDRAGSDSDGDGFADNWFDLSVYNDAGDGATEHLIVNSVNARGSNALTYSYGTNVEDVTITGDARLALSISSADALATVDATALKAGLELYVNADANDVKVDTNKTGAFNDYIDISNSTASKGKHTINTYGGDDTIVVDDGGSTVNAGDGKDKVTVSSGKDTVDLGAGDDEVVVGANLAAGDTFLGGAGRDTISVDTVQAGAGIPVDPITKAPLATVKAFEILGVTNTLANDVDLKNWTNADNTVDSIVLGSGFGTFKIDNIGANSSVTTRAASAGNTLTANLKDATGKSDVIGLIVKANATADFGTIAAPGVETVNVTFDDTTTTSKNTATLAVTDNAAQTMTVSGDYNAAVMTVTDLSELTTFDAGAFVGGVTVDLSANAKSLTVKGGGGADVLTFGAKGGNTITTGAGADTVNIGLGNGNTIDLGAGKDVLNLGNATNNAITLGADADTVNVTGVPTNGQSYSTIADFAKGDVIDLTGVTDVTFVTTKVTLAGTAVFQDYLDAVVAAGAAGTSGWFQFGGDTYVVADVGGDSATFTNAEDFVLKLTGAIDLSKATFDDVTDTITGG